MANQIVLSWIVDVGGSSIGPTQAAVALVAVPLYTDPETDPVLGQNFGLTVASDVSAASGPSTATRTLTLNMTAGSTPHAPPPFPCHPRTSTPPVLPYPLRTTKTLAGSFFVSNGATNIPTSATQLPSLATGDSIQFLSQEGVFYTVAAGSTATSINLTAPYTGTSGNSKAFKEIAAPVTLAALYSTSDLDTAGVATVPAIPAGAGARSVTVEYKDSTGAGPFSVTVSMTGKRPAAVALHAGSIDIAVITGMFIQSAGGFANSLGEITLVSLTEALPALPSNLPIGTGIGAAETNVGKVGAPVPRTFHTMTDDAQLLIDRGLAYLPPSYFALAQQGASTPQLAGDFSVTTGATNVPTTVDQTGALAATNIIEFADQPGTSYVVAAITPKILTLTTPYTGIDTNNTGANQVGTNADAGTKGNIGKAVINKLTGARLIAPSPAAPPTNTQLSGPLGQFVALETAAPPPNPPGAPATVPAPTFLSGLFTRQLQLALAGVPVVPQPITFL